MPVPLHVTGYADALVADIIGAAMNPQPSATAALSFMGPSVDSPSRFASALVTVDAAGVGSATMRSLAAALFVGVVSLVAFASPANADTVASLVNVHVRRGYNFPNAD